MEKCVLFTLYFTVYINNIHCIIIVIYNYRACDNNAMEQLFWFFSFKMYFSQILSFFDACTLKV